MKRHILLVLAATGLAACVQPATVAPTLPGKGGNPASCGADRLAHLTGKPLTSLPGDEVAGPLRVIRPGDAVTMDLNPGRLNVALNAQGIITALTCG